LIQNCAAVPKYRPSPSRVGGNGSLAMHDFIDAPGRNADVVGKAILANSHWPEEFLQQYFTRVNGRDFLFVHCCHSLVVVGDFYFKCVSILPFKANPPLIVDADAVLPLPVTV